jgi:hypothetical protein
MKRPEPIPLGVGDPEGRVGAIAVDDGTDVIDLIKGERLRLLAGIGSALMIDEPYLIGWQRQKDAPHRVRLFRVELPPSDAPPEWSEAFDVPAGDGSELELNVKLIGDETSYSFFWKARLRSVGGVPPLRRVPTLADGPICERIDLDSETLTIVARRREDGFAEEQALAGRGEQLARQAGGFIYRQAGQLRNAPWTTPSGERYLRALGGGDQRLAIARAEQSGLDDLVEIGAQRHGTTPELSLDGRHLALCEDDRASRVWNIFSTASGDRVGAVPYRRGFGAFRVFGHRLICLEEDSTRNSADLTIVIDRRLHCMDLHEERTAWVYPLAPKRVRDQSFLRPRF